MKLATDIRPEVQKLLEKTKDARTVSDTDEVRAYMDGRVDAIEDVLTFFENET